MQQEEEGVGPELEEDKEKEEEQEEVEEQEEKTNSANHSNERILSFLKSPLSTPSLA